VDLSKMEPSENTLKYSHGVGRWKVEEVFPHVRLIGIRLERAWKDNLMQGFPASSWLVAQENGDEFDVGILSALLDDASGRALHMIQQSEASACRDICKDRMP
jgi:hypothetical protein